MHKTLQLDPLVVNPTLRWYLALWSRSVYRSSIESLILSIDCHCVWCFKTFNRIGSGTQVKYRIYKSKLYCKIMFFFWTILKHEGFNYPPSVYFFNGFRIAHTVRIWHSNYTMRIYTIYHHGYDRNLNKVYLTEVLFPLMKCLLIIHYFTCRCCYYYDFLKHVTCDTDNIRAFNYVAELQLLYNLNIYHSIPWTFS